VIVYVSATACMASFGKRNRFALRQEGLGTGCTKWHMGGSLMVVCGSWMTGRVSGVELEADHGS